MNKHKLINTITRAGNALGYLRSISACQTVPANARQVNHKTSNVQKAVKLESYYEGAQVEGLKLSHKRAWKWLSPIVAATSIGLGATLIHETSSDCKQQEKKQFPIISLSEVEKHKTMEGGIWVTYRDSVYDITDFVANHPGGASKIVLAAGKSVEPFWQIYQQHLGNQAVEEQLSEMKIGILDPKDVEAVKSELDSNDPYGKEPPTHPALKVHYSKPVNAEIPPSLLMDHWITPSDIWYVRHHHPVPLDLINVSTETGTNLHLGIDIKSQSKLAKSLTLDDIKTKFKKRKVISTIQCGGNRRGGLDTVEKSKGTGWDIGAISNAEWGGVWLREILEHMGVKSPEDAEKMGIKHVQFESHDSVKASIPIEKALNPYGDALIAYEMNGEPIPQTHGSPLRAIIPGYVGVRNVKWLKSITLSDEESDGPWQRGMNYKVFSPSVKDLKGVDIDAVPTIQELPVQSVIVSPENGQSLEFAPNDELDIRGYAYSGGGRGIVRVDVSIDAGKTWHTATLKEGSEQNPNRAWAWTFWELSVPVAEVPADRTISICCKATDHSHNGQPEQPASIWNLRGLNNNSWHRVSVTLDTD